MRSDETSRKRGGDVAVTGANARALNGTGGHDATTLGVALAATMGLIGEAGLVATSVSGWDVLD